MRVHVEIAVRAFDLAKGNENEECDLVNHRNALYLTAANAASGKEETRFLRETWFLF